MNSESKSTVTLVSKPTWSETLKVYLEWPTLRMLFLGFSSGLPLLLVLGTLSFWLREAGIDRSTIGFLSWVGLMYGFKWVWAPLVDRLPIPLLGGLLGQRRSWLLIAQAIVMGGLVGMSMNDPKISLQPLIWCAVAVAFGSATQDIAMDAFRIESAETNRQAALAAAYQTGYRLAMIWAGAGVLWVASFAETTPLIKSAVGAANNYQHSAWQTAYLVMAASMTIGVLTVLLSREPNARETVKSKSALEWLHGALIAPFADFIQRYKWQAVAILALIAVYRISDVVMGIMANPFYVDMGYTKAEVATVTKVFGVIMTLLGAFIGGAMSMRLGVMRVLMLGSALSTCGHLMFAWLSTRGHDVTALIGVISAENLASGIASAAFVAFLSSLTNVNHSATQYALFSSLMLLLPKFLAGFSGVGVNAYGYTHFFTFAALMGVPVLLLVWITSRVMANAGQTAPKVSH